MRPSRSLLGAIALGCAVVGFGVWQAFDARLTTLALFLAVAVMTELFERSEHERTREPTDYEPFRLASVVNVAAILVLGAAAVVVAATGVLAALLLQAGRLRAVLFRASALAGATGVGWLAFRLAGGHVGRLELLGGLIPLLALGLAYLTVRTVFLDVLLRHENFEPRLGATAGEVALGATTALLAFSHPWNVVLLVPLAVAVHETQLRLTRLQRETLRALETFANIVDERDPSTYRHSIRVAASVDRLARALRLPFSDIDKLRWAGRLHDLGKIAVDSTVLRKADRLDREEWAAMRRHPRLSARLLQRFEFVSTQARAVELHHERVDGGGYYGVDAADLPLAAHFLIVADSFDAMTTDRPYRPGLSSEEALVEIERNIGTQFHPAVAKAFVALQRGLSPEDVLTSEELAELRGATRTYRLGVIPGARDFHERPELLALGGLGLALVGLGLHATWLAVAGGSVAAAGMALGRLARMRSERVADSLRAALHASDRMTLFSELVARLSRAWPVTWAALVAWDEDGLGGRVERAYGDGPPESAVMSWLVRQAESGRELIVAPAVELGREGIEVALPLRRETSALTGFLVLEGARIPPRHVELGLLETLDEIGLAFAGRPGSGRSRRQHGEPLEAVADAGDLLVARFDQR